MHVRAPGPPPGLSHVRSEIVVHEPRLWWSWDYGKPNLYELDAHLTRDGASDGDRARASGSARSLRGRRTGCFHLNGQRIYPRTADELHLDSVRLSQADRDFYARDLRLLLDAQLNSVRVHAHLERPEFYDLADELGIMVWQDFPLQWG